MERTDLRLARRCPVCPASDAADGLLGHERVELPACGATNHHAEQRGAAEQGLRRAHGPRGPGGEVEAVYVLGDQPEAGGESGPVLQRLELPFGVR